eukprot:CAMPEP_0171858602 /NCGR_PEP_ID=MMETSP0992-20121227/25396_1 /TAXON_ID=483369 /ORGANISM="non described non described, Strain CCMP2098" /LENGTH=160 /DNA_ID=CAMNT_0012480087 /DNA_START=63 /DNA_END=546 /DNA_ORIENTATION=-
MKQQGNAEKDITAQNNRGGLSCRPIENSRGKYCQERTRGLEFGDTALRVPFRNFLRAILADAAKLSKLGEVSRCTSVLGILRRHGQEVLRWHEPVRVFNFSNQLGNVNVVGLFLCLLESPQWHLRWELNDRVFCCQGRLQLAQILGDSGELAGSALYQPC